VMCRPATLRGDQYSSPQLSRGVASEIVLVQPGEKRSPFM
jgi:hypothetical protein